MVFSYYNNLSRANKAIYRQSNRTPAVRLSEPAQFEPLILRLRQALEQDLLPSTRAAAGQLCRRICEVLGVEPVGVKVLARRPSNAQEELHGLYEQKEGRPSLITVWMRTAKQKRVVAFRTFLRTLLHELCHHLDYTLLKLRDSYHTEGFFSRESSLVSQLISPVPPKTRKKKQQRRAVPKPVQIKMPW